MILTTALMCMALNIYHEARGEPIAGQHAVALVTMNRAETNDNVCDTVLAPKQFSWTNNLIVKTKRGYALTKGGVPKDKNAWESAVFTARLALNGKLPDFTLGATHFHADYVSPYWAPKMVRLNLHGVGRHIFYRGT